MVSARRNLFARSEKIWAVLIFSGGKGILAIVQHRSFMVSADRAVLEDVFFGFWRDFVQPRDESRGWDRGG